MAVDSRSNRLQLEAWKDRTMFDGRLAAASASPEFEHGGMFEDQNTCRESSIPEYSSKPGAPAKLYLDFRSHSEAIEQDQVIQPYGSFETSVCELVAATSPDNSSKSNSIGVRVIKEIWQAFSEKFAQFNVDVTTVHPGDFSDRKALRVAVARLYQDCYRSMIEYR